MPLQTRSSTVDSRTAAPSDAPRVSLYSPGFAADPHAAYAWMRAHHGALAPVELAPGVPATLVLDYRTALQILHDPDHFPADPRTWQAGVPPSCPILPMVGWRPNALRSDGYEHTRYRRALTAALEPVDLYALHATVQQLAVQRIDRFCAAGAAELIADYALPLNFAVLNELVGCPADLGAELVGAFADMFDAADPAAAATVEARIGAALGELIAVKRRFPDEDIATRLCQHAVGLTDVEVAHQLVTIYSAGSEPGTNLLVNTLLLMLTDARFAAGLVGGGLQVRDAIEHVLALDPPLANYCLSYPRQPVLLHGVWLPAHQPVLISMAAANTDPAIHADDRTGNRSHLAFSAGAHACPARTIAGQIAGDAVEQLLDALPDIRLAVPAAELEWRPGPFHRALGALPVTFDPCAAFPLTNA